MAAVQRSTTVQQSPLGPQELMELFPTDWPLHLPLARITTCGAFTLEVLQAIHPDADGHLTPVYGSPDPAFLTKKGTSTALILLSLLASQPGCFASKDFLSEHLRHLREEDEEEGDGMKRVDNVVSLLRHLLMPPRLAHLPSAQSLRRRLVSFHRASKESGPGYQLGEPALLWLDVEQIDAYIKHARAREHGGQESLEEWRAAYDLAARGPFLPQEPYSDWAIMRRRSVEAHLWDCVQALWRHYVEQGEAGEAEALRILCAYWQSHEDNEDALRPLLELLGKRECFGQAKQYYEQLCVILFQEGKQPDPRTQEIMAFLHAHQITRAQQRNKPLLFFEEQAGLPSLSAVHPDKVLSVLSQAITQGIVEGMQAISGSEKHMINDNIVDRRSATKTIMTFGLSSLASPLLHQEEQLTLWQVQLPIAWRLYYEGHIEEAQHILFPAALPQLTALLENTRTRKQAGCLASQACQLLAPIEMHHHNFGNALYYAHQGFSYGEEADNPNLQLASLIQQGNIYFALKWPWKELEAFQQALQIFQETKDSSEISPLLEGRMFIGLAKSYGARKDAQQALHFLGRAHEIYPEHPESDPAFSYSCHSQFTLKNHTALTYLNLGQFHAAWGSFAELEPVTPPLVPRRLELSIRQAAVTLGLNHLDEYRLYLESALILARQLGSDFRFQQAYELYLLGLHTWKQEPHLQALGKRYFGVVS